MKKMKNIKSVLCVVAASSEFSATNKYLAEEFGVGKKINIDGLGDFAIEFIDSETSTKWQLAGFSYQGQVESAVASSNLVRALKPSVTFMIGMCMGMPSRKYPAGTVIVPNEVVSFDHTRVTEKGVQIRPHGNRVVNGIYRLARILSETSELDYKVVVDKGLASANSKNENPTSQLVKFIEKTFPDAAAYDMEGFGFYSALDGEQCLWIKAVADSGEPQATDARAQEVKHSEQKSATRNAVAFAIQVVRAYVEVQNNGEKSGKDGDLKPKKKVSENKKISLDNSNQFVFEVGEEVVTYDEKMRSLTMDVVKVNAHTHRIGVRAEYEWIRHNYGEFTLIRQSLTTLDRLNGAEYDSSKIHFDCLLVKLDDDGGREKEIYFDISDFFFGGGASMFDRDGFVAKKLNDLYKK
ncbi:hypothetical protein GD416_35125 [Burkholderia sp. BE24]|uniref:hypothetical protein n=1 Tax=unclassified Burkholderia TaxID=2613784 RepID=UPI0011804290|nr:MULTISPECIES: hypothetical protein [unclassified Burkholderia]MPV61495.1 hypothetical protein [Burkholderia sp. BE24]